MTNNHQGDLSRRKFILTGLASTAGLVLAACNSDQEQLLNYATATPPADVAQINPTATALIQLEPTPYCDDEDEETPPQTEGPFYSPNTPERHNLRETGMAGTLMVVTGKVLTTDCQPVAGALLDFWHADDAGNYDNEGFTLRGHQYADESGAYRLETIVPGLYPGRTRHIHVKVQAPGGTLLTTQMYFPNEARNQTDSIFNTALLMDVQEGNNGKVAAFNFVVT